MITGGLRLRGTKTPIRRLRRVARIEISGILMLVKGAGSMAIRPSLVVNVCG